MRSRALNTSPNDPWPIFAIFSYFLTSSQCGKLYESKYFFRIRKEAEADGADVDAIEEDNDADEVDDISAADTAVGDGCRPLIDTPTASHN